PTKVGAATSPSVTLALLGNEVTERGLGGEVEVE
ncbi:MAG: hypothetical protein UZ07_CHB004001192, partial [Chlorobi bacterium OLB7]